METYITYSIYLHALLGGVGLLAGGVSVAVAKGKRWHTQSGKVFSVAMIGSALISLVVASLPNHRNTFLFLIGVFTIYMVLAGNRALTLNVKTKPRATVTDRIISGTMLLGSVAMVVLGIYGIMNELPNSVLFSFFGGIGLLMTLSDFKTFRTFQQDRHARMRSHIGKMVGALIASVTAFIVAGLDFKTLIAWLSPTLLGVPYIIYWTRRIKTKGKVVVTNET